MLNKVILVGYVGGDAEVRVLETGIKTARFRMATTERYARTDGTWGEHTEWHSVVAWREAADAAERCASKGADLYVEGSIRQRTAVDPTTKQSQTLYEIVAHTVRPANDAAPLAEPSAASEPCLAPTEEDPDGLPF